MVVRLCRLSVRCGQRASVSEAPRGAAARPVVHVVTFPRCRSRHPRLVGRLGPQTGLGGRNRNPTPACAPRMAGSNGAYPFGLRPSGPNRTACFSRPSRRAAHAAHAADAAPDLNGPTAVPAVLAARHGDHAARCIRRAGPRQAGCSDVATRHAARPVAAAPCRAGPVRTERQGSMSGSETATKTEQLSNRGDGMGRDARRAAGVRSTARRGRSWP